MRNLANEVRKIWNRMQKENSPNQVCLGDVVQEILVKHPDLLDRYNLQNITKRDTLTETIWNAIRQNQ